MHVVVAHDRRSNSNSLVSQWVEDKVKAQFDSTDYMDGTRALLLSLPNDRCCQHHWEALAHYLDHFPPGNGLRYAKWPRWAPPDQAHQSQAAYLLPRATDPLQRAPEPDGTCGAVVCAGHPSGCSDAVAASSPFVGDRATPPPDAGHTSNDGESVRSLPRDPPTYVPTYRPSYFTAPSGTQFNPALNSSVADPFQRSELRGNVTGQVITVPGYRVVSVSEDYRTKSKTPAKGTGASGSPFFGESGRM